MTALWENLPIFNDLKRSFEKFEREKLWDVHWKRYQQNLEQKIQALSQQEQCGPDAVIAAYYLSDHVVPSTQIRHRHEDEERVLSILRFIKKVDLLSLEDIMTLFHVVQEMALNIRRFYTFQLDKGVYPATAAIRSAYIHILPIFNFFAAKYNIEPKEWLFALLDHAINREFPDKSLDIITTAYNGEFGQSLYFDCACLIAGRMAQILEKSPNLSVPIPSKNISTLLLQITTGRGKLLGATSFQQIKKEIPRFKAHDHYIAHYMRFNVFKDQKKRFLIYFTTQQNNLNTNLSFVLLAPIDDINVTYTTATMEMIASTLGKLHKSNPGVKTIADVFRLYANTKDLFEREEQTIQKTITSTHAKTSQPTLNVWQRITNFLKKIFGKGSATQPHSTSQVVTHKQVIKKEKSAAQIFAHILADGFLIDAISDIHVNLPSDISREGDYELLNLFYGDYTHDPQPLLQVKGFFSRNKDELIPDIIAALQHAQKSMYSLFKTEIAEQITFIPEEVILSTEKIKYLLLFRTKDANYVAMMAQTPPYTTGEHIMKRLVLIRKLNELSSKLEIGRKEDAIQKTFPNFRLDSWKVVQNE